MDDALMMTTTMRMMAIDVDQSPSFARREGLGIAATRAPLIRFGENQGFVELR